jgi:ribonuclease PH
MTKIGERTIRIDCDVLQGDGGTRTASITGGFIALAQALQWMKKKGMIDTLHLKSYVAAISVGVFQGTPILDLNYIEDSKAEVDMNVVMLGNGEFVEVQGTGEGGTFSEKQMAALLKLAKKGIKELLAIQKKNLGNLKI